MKILSARSTLVALSLWGMGAREVHAHPADIGHLKIDVSAHRVEFRLTFNLLTLQRFAEIDTDQNGAISKAELDAVIPVIEGILREKVLVAVNGDDTDLGSNKPFHCIWPDPSADVAIADQAGRYVDLFFVRDSDKPIADVWLGIDFFHGPNDMLTIQALYQQGKSVTEVEFSALEPEFMYDTGIEEARQLAAVPLAQNQLAQDVFGNPALRISFAVLAFAAVASTLMKLRGYRRR